MARRMWVVLPMALVLASVAEAQPLTAKGTPFDVHGEQLQPAVPAGWKLAWMDGDRGGKGEVMQEYIPADQDIASWRGHYLTVGRVPLPPELLKEVAAMGYTLPQMVSMQKQQAAKGGCPGTFTEIAPRHGPASGGESTIAGGFCDRFGPSAPFGEGALVGFIQGREYLHRVEYHWRPADKGERGANLPYRIHPAQLESYLQAIKDTPICGGQQQPTCPAAPEQP